MTKMTTLLIAGLFMLLSTVSLNAQQNSAQKQTTVSKADIKNKQLPAAPYYKYKGIDNLEMAKSEWIKDHPEEYKKMANSNYKKPATAPAATYSDPNKDRRLPAKYDDSKTNHTTKN